jgi:membrane-associated phospholipid phosphatase
MVQALCTSGNCERLKSGVHGAAVVIAGVMAAYNIAACCFRRDRHLRINAIVYTLAVGFEIRQTLHHLRHTPSPAAGTADRPFASAKCA